MPVMTRGGRSYVASPHVVLHARLAEARVEVEVGVHLALGGRRGLLVPRAHLLGDAELVRGGVLLLAALALGEVALGVLRNSVCGRLSVRASLSVRAVDRERLELALEVVERGLAGGVALLLVDRHEARGERALGVRGEEHDPVVRDEAEGEEVLERELRQARDEGVELALLRQHRREVVDEARAEAGALRLRQEHVAVRAHDL